MSVPTIILRIIEFFCFFYLFIHFGLLIVSWFEPESVFCLYNNTNPLEQIIESKTNYCLIYGVLDKDTLLIRFSIKILFSFIFSISILIYFESIKRIANDRNWSGIHWIFFYLFVIIIEGLISLFLPIDNQSLSETDSIEWIKILRFFFATFKHFLSIIMTIIKIIIIRKIRMTIDEKEKQNQTVYP